MSFQPPSHETPSSRVELSISGLKLRDKDVFSKSDPCCIVGCVDNGTGHFYELARTEVCKDCLDPQWAKKIEMDYRFEERQVLRFGVYDWDNKSTKAENQDMLGSMECSLGEIMASQGTGFKKQLTKGGGTLIIHGEELSSSKEVVTLTFSANDLDKKDFFGKSDPFLIIYRCNENATYVPVHKTEYIKNTLNPNWKQIVIPARTLCRGDNESTIKIECFDWDSDGTHDLIGECYTNLSTLKEGAGNKNIYSLINPKKKAKKSSYKNSGILKLTSCLVATEHTFLDFIKGGLQMHFTVAVDFTASNGNPRQPGTLHYMQEGVDNQYALAIKSVGEIIQDYDADKQFPALGFGGKVPPNYEVSHEFFLNGSAESPYCERVDGVLAAYINSITRVQLYGPTNFMPVIRHVMRFAASYQDGNNYFVLLIITDGIITDMADTRAALVEASSLPMSVIIVGVGGADFSMMEMLDGDENRLSHNGMYASRDIVQFVELSEHMGEKGATWSRASLAREVLAEIPQQTLAWMKSGGFSPKILQ